MVSKSASAATDAGGRGLPSVHAFQVDLRGIVDLLSHHLYSSPRVFVRELLQNAVDAITARRVVDPGAPAVVHIIADGAQVQVRDSGIGLTEDEVHRFLATIGRSSKRGVAGVAGVAGSAGVAGVADGAAFGDGLGGFGDAESLLERGRGDFLGRFGIGLLACFVVADEISVVTKSAVDVAAPAVEWRGAADGHYDIRILAPEESPAQPGTTVTLKPSPGKEFWFQAPRVVELARDFGSLLPYETVLEDEAGYTYRITETPPVWDREYPSPGTRFEALAAYCQDILGFAPLDIIELNIPLLGIKGAAYILPTAATTSEQGGHRVHIKGMLLTDQARGLLPDWAFFVRCVIDTDALRPTASREALYEDDRLAAVREALGDRVRDWLAGLAATDPPRLNRLLAVHYLGVKALARFDDDLFALTLPWLPFETTAGRMPLTAFADQHRVVHLTAGDEEFQQVSQIAAAAGLGVVNGGYTYDADLVRKLPRALPGVTVVDLDPETIAAHLDTVDPAEELAAGPLLATARRVLDTLDCDAALRAYHPVTIPALLLDGREARHERARVDAEAEAAADGDDLWAGILGALRNVGPRARLVLNHRSPLIQGLIELEDAELAATGIEAVYGQALLLSKRPIRSGESALLNRAFLGLLAHAVGQRPASQAEEEG
ncbi:HSP90 family protein [Catenulispora pinisilvae]|uniref:HSP90 family protein n=1 Tax=Catenulispora pinisilvae TaxID=2705253 RepID=UPI0018916AEB